MNHRKKNAGEPAAIPAEKAEVDDQAKMQNQGAEFLAYLFSLNLFLFPS